MKKQAALWTVIVLAAGLVIASIFWWRQSEMSAIHDFESCARHYPVIDTFPEQCQTSDGQVFINN